MSRRGAGSEHAEERAEFEFHEASALAAPVLTVAKELLRLGFSAGEVCSLFTHAASALAKLDDGLERDDWLDLCAELYDRDELQDDSRLTAPGGEA